MNKNDLISAVADSSGLSKSDASSAVEGVFDAITKALSSGDEVRLVGFGGMKPSDIFRRHFMSCFIDDAFGLKNLDAFDENMVAYECDYPHSDTLWPEVPEHLWESVKELTEEQIEKVTHRNAMRYFNFDLFSHFKREEVTVGALRAKAAADGVDTSPQSYGGDAPLAAGEEKRRIVSGDLMKMFAHHAKSAEERKAG